MLFLIMKEVYHQPFPSQTVQQIEVIQVLVSPEVSKLNHSVMNKKIVTCHSIISSQLMDRVIKQLIHQNLQEMFSSVSKCLSSMEKNH